jgi:hypothetical protein
MVTERMFPPLDKMVLLAGLVVVVVTTNIKLLLSPLRVVRVHQGKVMRAVQALPIPGSVMVVVVAALVVLVLMGR